MAPVADVGLPAGSRPWRILDAEPLLSTEECRRREWVSLLKTSNASSFVQKLADVLARAKPRGSLRRPANLAVERWSIVVVLRAGFPQLDRHDQASLF
jgi:hypothetical protein